MTFLRFKNSDACDSDITLNVSVSDVEHIARWYGAFYAGDRYSVFIDGKKVRKDRNGDIVGWDAGVVA